MTAEWIVAAAALLIAVIAFAQARRTARQLAILEEQYWQLKFEHGELKARLEPSPESKPNFIPLIRRRPASAEGSGETGSSEVR